MAKRKSIKDKQRSTKHIHKTKDRVTRTLLKTGGELRCFGRVSSPCSTSDIRRVNQVTKYFLYDMPNCHFYDCDIVWLTNCAFNSVALYMHIQISLHMHIVYSYNVNDNAIYLIKYQLFTR